MADEFEILENPTSTPAAVSTGYQRQNTNSAAQRVGVDMVTVESGVGQITVKISGPIDVNGILYEGVSAAILAPASGAGRYYVRLIAGTGTSLTPQLTQDIGTFDPTKNARYDGSGYRILNWLIDYDGTNCRVEEWITPYAGSNSLPFMFSPETTFFTSSGTWVAKYSNFYDIWITAPGDDGGDGGDGGFSSTDPTGATSGGKSGISGFVRQWVDAGESFAIVISSTISSMISSGHTIFATGPSSGDATLGVDKDFPNGGISVGGHGGLSVGDYGQNGHPGGASIWGSGGYGGSGGVRAAGAAGGNGSAYGSGGGGGGGGGGNANFTPVRLGGAGGTGALGIIVIIG